MYLRQSGLGMVRRRRRSMGDDSIDLNSLLTTTINDAATVAKVAVTPPTYSAVVNPLTGAQTITAYGTTGTNVATSSLGAESLSTLLSNPMFLLLGVGLILVIAMKK